MVKFEGIYSDPDENYIRVKSEILFSGGWDPTEIEYDKILIRRTGENIISTLDTEKYYHTNALIYGTPLQKPSQIHLGYLVCFINYSSWTGFIARQQ